MSDLISRQAAIKDAESWVAVDEYEKHLQKNVVEWLKELPPAQPDLSEYSDKLWQKAYERGKAEAQAEIVRCKDCKYWNKGSCECSEIAVNCQDYYVGDMETEAEHFCGYAERRTNE